jgi:hypothetical protein
METTDRLILTVCHQLYRDIQPRALGDTEDFQGRNRIELLNTRKNRDRHAHERDHDAFTSD